VGVAVKWPEITLRMWDWFKI